MFLGGVLAPNLTFNQFVPLSRFWCSYHNNNAKKTVDDVVEPRERNQFYCLLAKSAVPTCPSITNHNSLRLIHSQ